MKVSTCCKSIPWDDSDVCAECLRESQFKELTNDKNDLILSVIKRTGDTGTTT